MHPKNPNRNAAQPKLNTVPENTAYYTVQGCIGSGTFGSIYLIVTNTGHKLALKKVLQDPHYKNRELQIIKEINHPNCLHLHNHGFVSEGDSVFLYLYTDYLPMDLHMYLKKRNHVSNNLLKIFGYQLFNGLAYIHRNGITHRDIKTSNVLVDPTTGNLEICDFGSAKKLLPNEPSVFYISTRSYRAPELLYCSSYYTSQIDVWAAGCVIAEMRNNGQEIFRADSNDDLQKKICRALGSPTQADYNDMGAQATFPSTGKIKGAGIKSLFKEEVDPLMIDLLEQIFVYSPHKRITAEQAKKHIFFKGVAEGTLKLDNGMRFVLPPGA